MADKAYYRWKRKYAGVGGDHVQRLKQLEQENAQLKQALAESSQTTGGQQYLFEYSYNFYLGFGVMLIGLCFTSPQDLKAQEVLAHGRRVRRVVNGAAVT